MAEREVLLTAVRDALERASMSEDMSAALEADALAAARRLTEMLRDDDSDLNARYLLGWLHWYRYKVLPEGQDRADLVAAVEALAPCFIAGAGELPTALLPVLADHAVPVATELLRDARITADPELGAACAALWQRIVAATPNDYPGRPGRLSHMGIAILAKFELTRALADADSAVTAAQDAIDAAPGRASRPRWNGNQSQPCAAGPVRLHRRACGPGCRDRSRTGSGSHCTARASQSRPCAGKPSRSPAGTIWASRRTC